MVAASNPITVVIPLYNKKENILNTIKSVINQTYQAYEIILIDDGSTDGGADILNDLNSKLIRIIRKKNEGVSIARNLGVSFSKTPYVAFLDADDLWQKDHLYFLNELINRYPDSIFYSSGHISMDNINLSYLDVELNSIKENQYQFFPDFIAAYAKSLSIINSSSACVLKEEFLRVGGFPEKVTRGEDVILWVKLGLIGGCAFVNQPTSIYNRGGINRVGNSGDSSIPASLHYIKELINSRQYENTKKSLLKLFNSIAFYTSAGMRELGNTNGTINIFIYAIKERLFVLAFKVLIILFMPVNSLALLKKMRRHFR